MAVMFRSVLQNAGGAAELIVTCADQFAGKTISCSDGTTTLTKTCPSTSPYTVAFKIPNSGDWTISATVSGVTYTSDPVSVLLDYTAELSYGFDWRRWVDASVDLDSTDYSTLSDLLADEEAIRELCLVHDCVDYLCNDAIVTADLATVINNDLFAKWVNLSDYALDNMYANAAIADEMDTAGKYGFGEWALVGQVPKMTSATAPYGVVVVSSQYSGQEAWRAFDGLSTTLWSTATPSLGWIGYINASAYVVKKFKINLYVNHSVTFTFKVKASNDDGTTWTEFPTTYECAAATYDNEERWFTLDNDTAYSTYAIEYLSASSSSGYSQLRTLQFYAWQPKGNVPVMTSATAPYGTVLYSTAYSGSNNAAYNAFDGYEQNEVGGSYDTRWVPSSSSVGQYIGYTFVLPVLVKRIRLRHVAYALNTTIKFKVQGSNDGFTNDVHDLTSEITANTKNETAYKEQIVDIENGDFYLSYRIYYTTSIYASGGSTYILQTLTLYGRELSVSVPKMDTNTTPYGEASASSSQASEQYPYKAFDGSDSSYWCPTRTEAGTIGAYISYDFLKKVAINFAQIKFLSSSSYQYYATSFKIQGSNTGNVDDWNDVHTVNNQSSSYFAEAFTNNNEYRYYRVLILGVIKQYDVDICTLQFYGKDYSEKEFEVGTTRKWLYDHGLEWAILETTGGGSYKIEPSSVVITAPSNQTENIGYSTDLTDYNYARFKMGNRYVHNSSNFFGIGSTVADATGSLGYVRLDSNLPYNLAVDVSADNQTAYVKFFCGYNATIEYSEMWLD